MNLSIKVINNTSDFILFKNVWQKFETEINHTNITSSYCWLSNWWKVFEKVEDNIFGYNKELLIICLYEDEKLIAIAPFVKLYRKKMGLRIYFIEFLGQQRGGTYLDIIGINLTKQHIEFIFEWLHKNVKYHLLFLKYIPEDTNNFNKKDLYLYNACPQINLKKSNSYEDYVEKNYSKKLKQNLRTALNRAKKNNQNIEKKIDIIDEYNFKEIVNISKSKLIDNKSWLYGNELSCKFYKLIYEDMNSNVVFIKMNKRNVAYRTNIIFNNTKFCLDASYDRNLRKYDPGILSVDLNIKDSFDKNLDIHCLGPGIGAYKMKFTKDVKIFNFYIKKGNTILSLILFILLRKMVIKKSKDFKQNLNNVLKTH